MIRQQLYSILSTLTWPLLVLTGVVQGSFCLLAPAILHSPQDQWECCGAFLQELCKFLWKYFLNNRLYTCWSMYIKSLANILSFIQTVWCITQSNSEQTTDHFPPKSNCQFSFWFALDPTFGIKKPGSVSRTARWTVFLSSLTDYKAAWLVHLHKKRGTGEGFNQRLNHLFVSQQSFVVLLSCPAQSVILSFVCCLVSLRFPPLVLNPGWVSLFHNIFLFVDHSRGEDAEMHW